MLTHKQYKHLVEEMIEPSRQYYNGDETSMSNEEWDKNLILIQEYESKNQPSPQSPTQVVHGEDFGRTKLKHPKKLGSIQDVFDYEDTSILTKAKALAKGDEVKLVAEPKLDGLAINLIYEKGKLTKAISRGDYHVGDDVMGAVKHIPEIPLSLDIGVHTLAVQGEIYFTKEDFFKCNSDLVKAGKKPLKNIRNGAAGSFRSMLNYKEGDVFRQLSFLAHGCNLVLPNHFTTYSEKKDYLVKAGIPYVQTIQTPMKAQEITDVVLQMEQGRATYPYPIDGCVIKVDDLTLASKLSNSDTYASGMVAYKFPPEAQETTLLDVQWQTGKRGQLTPVAILKPVDVGGNTVTHATLSNPGIIRSKGLKLNQQVYVALAGDIIPEVVGVCKDQPNKLVDIDTPTHCPSCNGLIEESPDTPVVFCVNPQCPAQLTRYLVYCVGRDVLNLLGIGDKIVEELVDKGLVQSPADFFTLTDKEIPAKKIRSIASSREQPLERIIRTFNVPNVGKSLSTTLAERFKTLTSILSLKESDFDDIKDVEASTTGRVFVDALPRIRTLVDDYKKYGVIIKDVEGNSGTDLLKDRKYVITGKLNNITRRDLTDKLKYHGAEVTSTVTSATTHLICNGSQTSSKYKKAKSLDVAIISEEDILNEMESLEIPKE